MGLEVTVKVHINEAAVFGDIHALNKELNEKSDIGELLQNFPHQGFVDVNGPKILFFDVEGEEFESSAIVYGCFNLKEAKIMAKYLASGKLVLRQDIEGNDPIYYVLTPKKAEIKEPSF